MSLAVHVTSANMMLPGKRVGSWLCTCSVQDLWIHRLVVQEAAENSHGCCAHRNILAPQPY